MTNTQFSLSLVVVFIICLHYGTSPSDKKFEAADSCYCHQQQYKGNGGNDNENQVHS